MKASISSHNAAFRACYEARPPGGERVVVRFEIDERGRVTSAHDAGSDITDAKVIDCVVKEATTVVFSPPAGGKATVVHPIGYPED